MANHSHIEQSRILHNINKNFGAAESYSKENEIKKLLNIPEAITSCNKNTNHSINSVLDYGTGKGGLIQLIKTNCPALSKVEGFDPAVKEYSKIPTGAYDLITCIDVLEHIDRDSVTNTLQTIKKVTNKYFFYSIDLVPAKKRLTDGRNAHILIAPPEWWSHLISEYFTMNLSFQLGKLPDGTRYPVRLIGCATNQHIYYDGMIDFIDGSKLTEKEWILKTK